MIVIFGRPNLMFPAPNLFRLEAAAFETISREKSAGTAPKSVGGRRDATDDFMRRSGGAPDDRTPLAEAARDRLHWPPSRPAVQPERSANRNEVRRAVPTPQEEVASGQESPLQALRRIGSPPHRPMQEVLGKPEVTAPDSELTNAPAALPTTARGVCLSDDPFVQSAGRGPATPPGLVEARPRTLTVRSESTRTWHESRMSGPRLASRASRVCSSSAIGPGSPETIWTRQVVHRALPPHLCRMSIPASSIARTSFLPASTSNDFSPWTVKVGMFSWSPVRSSARRAVERLARFPMPIAYRGREGAGQPAPRGVTGGRVLQWPWGCAIFRTTRLDPATVPRRNQSPRGRRPRSATRRNGRQ